MKATTPAGRGAGFTPPDFGGSRFLRYRDLMRVGFREVVRKRRRYIGVVAAIALGTAGLIIVVTMGRDLKKNFNNDLDILGGATIINAHFEFFPMEKPEWFRDYTIKALSEIPGASVVANTVLQVDVETTWHDRSHKFSILGVDQNYWSIFGFTPALGRLFDASDIRAGARVCVLGAELARLICGTEQEAMGSTLTIDGNLYTVIGILGGVRAGDRGRIAFLPLSTALARINGISKPYNAYIRCSSWDDVDQVAERIPAVVAANQTSQGLVLYVSWEALKHVKRVYWWVTLFIYMSIGATIVLGGFGIWNIMMAAVTARTREIGLKKAMGAEDADILLQFLFEALSVTVTASILGVILGRAGVEYMGMLIGSSPPEGLFLLCLILGLIFAVVLGLGSGLLPSIRASRMQVVDAMRYE
ncbi:MAG: ABC transporter permease [Desulfovibrionaceae bacterium]|nr:ABC transporter permease [Desulfovibrionaceae bacterium]MBF0514585.1 ABC transporter permease [Desulfovibrionaceae bacterium]